MFFTKKKRLFISSLPKSGTHLLQNVLKEMGYKNSGIFLDNRIAYEKSNLSGEAAGGITVGVDIPSIIKPNVIKSYLENIRNGRFVSAHLPYSLGLCTLLDGLKYSTIAVIRDPRDVAVSHAHFISTKNQHYLYPVYSKIDSFDERLLLSIKGICEGQYEDIRANNVAQRFQSITDWTNYQDCLIVRFEDLVGLRGGGSGQKQKETVERIAEHLELTLSTLKLKKVCNNSFGGSHTFRKGTIGGWKKCFNNEHKKIFKNICGDLLIDSGYEKDFSW